MDGTMSAIEFTSGTYRSRVDGTLYERLIAKAVKDAQSGCWEWTACTSPGGYGAIQIAGKKVTAHRAMWRAMYGDPPAGIFVCHRCDNKRCINPNHLFAGTAMENNRDRSIKGRSFRGTGERHPNSRFTDVEVAAAVARTAAGETRAEVAAALGVSSSTVDAWKRRHGVRVGKRGQRNGNAKLSDTDVVAVRARLALGESQMSIGRAFGVSGSAIGRIAHGARA